MNIETIFNYVLDYIRENCKVSSVAFNLWLECITPLDYKLDPPTAVLNVPDPYQKKIIESQAYIDFLREGFEYVMGTKVEIDIIDSQDIERMKPYKKEEEVPFFPHDEMERNSQGGDYEYTFDTFIVGSSNKFAHAASIAVADKPGKAYNPLFIYGGSGLGKTHLLNAINLHIKNKFPEYNVLYVKGETFTNELVEALKEKSTVAFHQKYRSADVLLMDDIQFIAGKEQTQEEFFHTFEALHKEGKQIVVTSDRPPKEIKTLEDRIKTRFEWGLLADVQKPEFETRVAIIKRKAELLNITIPNDVCDFMATKLKDNIRQLEGAVKKMKAYKKLAGSELTISLATTAIKDIISENQPIPVTVERIINEVGRTFGVDPNEIRSRSNKAPISSARQAAIYIIREITQMPLASIGEEFGRDHATMSYATTKVAELMSKDEHYRLTIEDIVKNIRNM